MAKKRRTRQQKQIAEEQGLRTWLEGARASLYPGPSSIVGRQVQYSGRYYDSRYRFGRPAWVEFYETYPSIVQAELWGQAWLIQVDHHWRRATSDEVEALAEIAMEHREERPQ